jgi:crossover junction endodeoxyribonuclease RuvC
MIVAASSQPITIIGIDPGYDRLGWCIGTLAAGVPHIKQFGIIQTSATQTLFERYLQLQKELEEIIHQFKPQEAAIESLFFFNNAKSAMKVAEARGIILACLLNQQVHVEEYTPLEMKQAVTGFGRADKKAVERMLRLQFHLTETKIMDDTMDAIGMMLAHAVSRELRRH